MREIVSAIKRLEKMENRRAANAGGELWSGWQPVGDTWTYASSTTFTISGDVTDYYCVGMFVKWTQSATVKYGIITNATYSDPNTTITIEGDAVANETISGNYVSRAFAPQGATHSQVFTGVLDNLAHGETAGKYLKSDGDNSASFVTFPDHDHTGDAGDGGVLTGYKVLDHDTNSGSTNTTTSSTSFGDLNSMSVSIKVTQNALIKLHFHCYSRNDTGGKVNYYQFYKTGTGLLENYIVDHWQDANTWGPFCMELDDEVAAGTHAYKVQWKVNGGTGTVAARYMSATAWPM